MKRRITAIFATVLVAITCITSAAAASCRTCGGTLDELGCTRPNLNNMSSSVVVTCYEHTGCEKVYYYADTITYCPTCRVTGTATTHQCALGHKYAGTSSVYEAESVCKFW